MAKKIKLFLALVSLSICLGLMSSTYSRYVASTTGDINASFSKWQILVNNHDITNGSNSDFTVAPTMEENPHIADGTIAPTSKGYIDFDIDPSNVDVSFKYMIDLEVENDNIPDLLITKYVILPDGYEEGDPLTPTPFSGGIITNNMFYNKSSGNFKFKPFTIRIFFEWYEGINEQMDDEADTAIGVLAAKGDVPLKIKANISFEQIVLST